MVTKMVELGVARYQCNYNLFCHHISYYSTRELCNKNAVQVRSVHDNKMRQLFPAML